MKKNIEFYKGSLPIHHIDYNKQNSSINNLITLCNSCHAKTNANRKQWKEKLQKIKSIRKLDIKPDKVYNIEVKDNNFETNYFVYTAILLLLDVNQTWGSEIIFRVRHDVRATFFGGIGGKGPWFRNHFWRASKDSGEPESEYFFQLFFDDNILVEQGRFTWEQLELAKLQDDYDVLFRCLFPSADIIDKEGYMPLFTKKFIDDHITKNPYMYGKKRLGVDVSYSGADSNCYVLRGDNLAKMIKKDHVKSPSETIQSIIFYMEQFGISDRDVWIDGTAGGNAFVDSMKNQGFIGVHGINFGEKAILNEKYSNRKAEGYFKLKEWLSKGGMLYEDPSWYQLENIKYKPDGTGRIQDYKQTRAS